MMQPLLPLNIHTPTQPIPLTYPTLSPLPLPAARRNPKLTPAAQVSDGRQRLAFLQRAEALQLYLELERDAALAAARWAHVGGLLLQRPFNGQSVLDALSLTDAEKTRFRVRLESKDLASEVDGRTIKHLLLRAEGVPPAALPPLRRLAVEKVIPQTPPEGSMWRKTKVAGPAAAAAVAATATVGAASSSGSSSADASSSSSSPAAVDDGMVKYWFDVQRMMWHGRLGNLVLLEAGGPNSSDYALADYPVKAEHYALRCRAGQMFPRFSGAVALPGGKYAAHKFSFEECRQRHQDVIAALAAHFNL